MRASLFSIGALALAVSLTGCSADQPMTGSPELLRKAQDTPYSLGTGDKLHITVFGEDNLSGDYVVSSDGNIALPLVGNIHAAGLTIPQLQQAVTDGLDGRYVQNPRVTIEASSLRPYYILGEVNKPGQYSYVPDLTVLAAVATAQGFTYRADMSYILIRHAREPSEQQYPITATTMIEPGDTIRVTQRYF